MALSLDFSGKNAIVTGGASGIGRAIVEGIVSGGGHAIIVDYNMKLAAQVCSALPAESASAYELDLSNTDSIAKVMNQIIADFGQVHVLVNCAGIVSTKKFLELGLDEWNRVLKINLTAPFVMCQTLLPNMIAHKYGRIVNVASVAAIKGGGLLGTCAYAASKNGVIALTKTVAKEGAPYGITCNAVCPSFTRTPLTSIMTAEKAAAICAQTPLGRAADPKEPANMILFFASDLSSYCEGEIGYCDGGITMCG